ncbi:hypothetical protein BKA81DRAFT_360144, partial [Phyllosticta paracitricarpa]
MRQTQTTNLHHFIYVSGGTAVGGNSRPRLLLQEPPRLRREAPSTTPRCCSITTKPHRISCLHDRLLYPPCHPKLVSTLSTVSAVCRKGRRASVPQLRFQRSQIMSLPAAETSAGDNAQGDQTVVDHAIKGSLRIQLLLRQTTRSNCGSLTTAPPSSQCISRICGSVVCERVDMLFSCPANFSQTRVTLQSTSPLSPLT